MRRAATAVCVVSTAAVIALGGCDEPRKEPRPIFGASPSAVASALGIDAGAIAVEATDPAPPSGDLKTEMLRFRSLDACVKEHAGTDPLVGDSLYAIGYDTVIRDSCRILEALSAKDERRCDPIASSTLRAHCQNTVAIAYAAPAR